MKTKVKVEYSCEINSQFGEEILSSTDGRLPSGRKIVDYRIEGDSIIYTEEVVAAGHEKNHYARNLILPIIKSTETAKKFTELCDNRDWGHTYGLDQNDQTVCMAWRYRASINERLREIRQSAGGR